MRQSVSIATMRKLIAIVIAGVAILAIVYFAHLPGDTVVPAAAAPERQQPEVPKQDVATELVENSSPAQVPPLTADQQQQAACGALWQRRTTREKAALDAEPKDPAWAYPMEQ